MHIFCTAIQLKLKITEVAHENVRVVKKNRFQMSLNETLKNGKNIKSRVVAMIGIYYMIRHLKLQVSKKNHWDFQALWKSNSVLLPSHWKDLIWSQVTLKTCLTIVSCPLSVETFLFWRKCHLFLWKLDCEDTEKAHLDRRIRFCWSQTHTLSLTKNLPKIWETMISLFSLSDLFLLCYFQLIMKCQCFVNKLFLF